MTTPDRSGNPDAMRRDAGLVHDGTVAPSSTGPVLSRQFLTSLRQPKAPQQADPRFAPATQRSVAAPPPLSLVWCATWHQTDETVASWNYVASTNLGDVNRYSLVKPMVPIWDCDSGNLDTTTAHQFLTDYQNCGRFQATVTALKTLPPGMRCVRMQRYDNWFPFARAGDRIQSQGYTFQVPWADVAGEQVRQDISQIGAALAAQGALADYVALDSPPGEYTNLGFWEPSPLSSSVPERTAFISAMTGDARASQPYHDLPQSLLQLYTFNGAYPLNFADLISRTFHPQTNRSYLYWNRAIWGIQTEWLNEYLYRPMREHWSPGIKFSNFDSMVLNEGTDVYSINGHPEVYANIAGDAAAPTLYASWNPAWDGVYGVRVSDPTRLVRNNYGEPTTPIQASGSAWKQLLFLIQKLRGVRRDNPNVPLRPWLSSVSLLSTDPASVSSAFFPAWLEDTTGIPQSASRGLYWESIRHFAISSVEMFNLWNWGDANAQTMQANIQKMNDVLTEVNQLTGGFRGVHSTSTERVSFLADYVATGIKVADYSWLWRVTPNPKKRITPTPPDSPIPLHVGTNFVKTDQDGGIWMYTSTDTTPVFSSENAPAGWSNSTGFN
jgi:hypothetical protein